MQKSSLPANETERLQALHRYEILDTSTEKAFDDLTHLASYICGTPMALVSLVDRDRQWFKAKVGLEITETPREVSFCAHAICQPEELFIVPNALEDKRFAANPLVTSDPNVRFYAGVPILTPDGQALGTLCALDRVPRNLEPQQQEALKVLGRQVISQLELRLQLAQIQQTQAQLVQSEKMAALGKLVAGIAHEINNPINFIQGNLKHLEKYSQELLNFVQLCQSHDPQLMSDLATQAEEIDLEFLQEDLSEVIKSMRVGTERIGQIVLSLKNFSRLDEAEFKRVDIHEGLDSTLLVLQHRLSSFPNSAPINVIKDYAQLPAVDCYPGQLNQAFLNIMTNAIDALIELENQRSPQEERETPAEIRIQTSALDCQWVQIVIADNGLGMVESVSQKVFDYFFTTKPVGKGKGIGLSISYQIVVEKHGGKLDCFSTPERGTKLIIQLPIRHCTTS
ncbi:MAG: ATP-binding protein [Jaaginema sp. PMC 1079.18]|nr:ATP-binding protein [Jaaginema sp. PMC 1080.18]MEC4849861.1 ATP-binding protein [Jaaginema sp. PMC 1079.18]MEC4865249.1 ATP-binding protein [Jaaginema sp. PMC 1078.18]